MILVCVVLGGCVRAYGCVCVRACVACVHAFAPVPVYVLYFLFCCGFYLGNDRHLKQQPIASLFSATGSVFVHNEFGRRTGESLFRFSICVCMCVVCACMHTYVCVW